MSNLPPDWRPEPREHDERCAALCDDNNCEHDDHECTCDELHEQDAEREAEAFVDWIAIDASVDASIADVLLGIRDRIRKEP